MLLKAFFLIVVALTLGPVLVFPNEVEHAGVVVFFEKDSIGLEDAGKKVAGWIVEELRHSNKFQIKNKLLPQEVFKDRFLLESVYLDKELAMAIGGGHGIEYIIAGFIQKINNEIKVTARVLDVNTGGLLKAVSTSMSSVKFVENEIKAMAKMLSDISKSKVKTAKKPKVERNYKISASLGGGLGMYDGGKLFPINGGLGFSHKWVDIYAFTIPYGAIMQWEAGIVAKNIPYVPYVGLGIVGGLSYDAISETNCDIQYLLVGLTGKYEEKLEIGFFTGLNMAGTWGEDDVALPLYAEALGSNMVYANYYYYSWLGLSLRYSMFAYKEYDFVEVSETVDYQIQRMNVGLIFLY
ncbi:MAG: hypothetical protein HQK83_11045 [Fibrobacteria bacterium]|nr:hypothetical protein [Fibrobacteria bacterium]